MRLDGGRAKKLIVAFHFQFSDQAKWRCDICRRQGLESKRGCGFEKGRTGENSHIVWARGRVALTECPISFITSDSIELLERYYAWRLWGGGDYRRLNARHAEAFLLLEEEWRREANKDDERA